MSFDTWRYEKQNDLIGKEAADINPIAFRIPNATDPWKVSLDPRFWTSNVSAWTNAPS